MALSTDTLYLQAILPLLSEDESLGKTSGGIETNDVVGEVGLLVISGVLHSSETVYLLVRLAHNHELATTQFHQFGDELQLSLKLQTCVHARVGVA